MYKKYKLKILVFLVLKFVINVNGDIYEACNETPNHAFIASNTSCSHYIYCADDESYEGQCPDGDYFNESLQTCDPKDLVDCKLNNSNDINTNFPLSTQTSTTPVTLDPPFSTIKTTSEITTRDLSTSTSSMTPLAPVNTNTTSTVMPSDMKGEIDIIVSSGCPSADNPRQMIFVPNSKSCSDYFICYHGDKLAMHCSAMLHFDANTGKCDYPENVRCQTDFTNPKEQCQSHIIDLFPHTTNCNYFYSCRNGYLMLQQCPFGYGWDFEKRACTMLQRAICYNKKINELKY